MDKRELVEKIKEDIPKDLNEIELAKYIYIELAKIKSFDIKYFYGNNETKQKICKLAEQEKNNTDKIASKREIVCITISHLYQDILSEFGIKSIIEQSEEEESRYKHRYNLIILKNGEKITADIQRDLSNIQTKSKTAFFGIEPDIMLKDTLIIDDEQMLGIDKKIGYVESENNYRDTYIKKIQEDVKNMGVSEAVEYVLNNENIYNVQQDMGYLELKAYYRRIFDLVLTKYNGKNAYLINTYRKREDGEKEYTMCAYTVENDNVKVYLYSQKYNRFVNVEFEEFLKLEQEGLVIGRSPKEIGVKLLKKKMNKKRESQKECGEEKEKC